MTRIAASISPTKLTAAAAAFLAFGGELLAGRLLLPQFGGCAFVWCATVLFFQLVLIAGYYASQWLGRASVAQRFLVFLCLGLSGLCVLAKPLLLLSNIPVELQPLIALAPFAGLSIGLFCTTPLLHQAQDNRNDFSIYAWSNAGALAGLLAYPFIIEPFTTLTTQRWVWAVGGALICVLGLARTNSTQSRSSNQGMVQSRWQWWVLPAISSATLLATTNQLSYETSAGPLAWALPLALFLGSYVWAFSGDHGKRIEFLTILGLASMIGQAFVPARSWQALATVLVAGGSVMAICHIKLAATRNANTHAFYLASAIGGAAASVVMIAVIPRVLSNPIEFAVLILGTLSFAALTLDSMLPKLLLTTAAVIAVGLVTAVKTTRIAGQVAHCRSLYACLRVVKRPKSQVYVLISNTTLHGAEDRDHPQRELTYYIPETGLGRAVTEKHAMGKPLSVGVVGLGAGTINRLLQSQDCINYFEINPQVEQMAREYFTFLRTPTTRVVIGDGRKSLEQEPQNQFDILVLDAFTGDAIPAHLLTREAGQVYRRCLKSDGILAIHFTNSHIDLRPVIAALARSMNMSMEIVITNKIDWAILRPGPLNPAEKLIEWTDERNSILSVLR